MPFPFGLGVVDVVYASCGAIDERARLARDDGFEHIDPMVGTDPASIVLPIGCPTAFPRPAAGWCSTPAPADGPGRWEKTVERFRAAPGCLMEPWAGSVVGSTERVLAMLEAVPGLQLLVDTGHVSDWGGDPLELLPYARHVQLRQGSGSTQLHVDDPRGVVDFAAVAARLRPRLRRPLLGRVLRSPRAGLGPRRPRAWALDLAGPPALPCDPRLCLVPCARMRSAPARERPVVQAGPRRQREARGRHAFPRDDVAGDRVGRVEGAQVGAAEAAVGREPLAVDLEEVDDGAVGSTTRTPCSIVDAT